MCVGATLRGMYAAAAELVAMYPSSRIASAMALATLRPLLDAPVPA